MKSVMFLFSFLLAVLCTAQTFANTIAPSTLTLKHNGQETRLTHVELLRRPDAADITVPADIAYKRAMQFRAIPLRALLQENGFTTQGTLNFLALDGFAAPLDAAQVLNNNAARAWLAVEAPDKPWPPLSAKGLSAGPFYLVWMDSATPTKAARIPQEQWPYQIAVIEQTLPPEQRFPMMLPDLKLPKHHDAWKGFEVFKTHCIACHKINGGGEGLLGPDLNQPHNPTQYFAEPYLKLLIRNPAQVRHWPDAKMPGFSEQTLSNESLDALIAYLKAMAKPSAP